MVQETVTIIISQIIDSHMQTANELIHDESN